MSYTPNDGTIPAGVVYNPSGNDLTKWKAALNRVATNAGNAHVLYVGTSTVEGANSGGPNNWELAHTLEALLATDLTNIYGLPSNADSIFGSNLPISDADPRVVVGAGWVADTVYSIGGPMLINTTTTNTLDYTMPTTADKVKIWYATDNSGTPTLGTWSWHVNSGSSTNINAGISAPGVASTTITLTPGANVLHIARVSGTCKIIGVEPYLSTVSTINIINSGVGGVVAANFTDASAKAYATNTAWNAISPDLTLIQMDNNDALSATNTTTYKTNITSIITGSNNGDCVLISQIPYGSVAGDVTVIPTYVTALKQVALASSVPFIDQTKWITSYDNILTPLGWSNSDGLHASPLGYVAQSNFILDQIMSIINVKPVSELRYFNGITDTVGATNGLASVGPYWLTAQATLNVSGTPITNGPAQAVMRVGDITTGGAAGLGGGIGLFFDDGTSTPRMGSAIWTSKLGASGHYGADTFIGGRADGASVSTMLKLSATTALSTFTGGVSATQYTSTIATGTAPLVVTSTTPVANLSIGGNAATVTTNANLTGDVTSSGNATTIVKGVKARPYISGNGYLHGPPGEASPNSTNTTLLVNNTVYAESGLALQNVTITKVTFKTSSSNAGTGVSVKVGIYGQTAGGLPGALLGSTAAGTSIADSATSTITTITLDSAAVVPAGQFFIALLMTSTVGMRVTIPSSQTAWFTFNGGSEADMYGSSPNMGYTVAQTYSTGLPNPFGTPVNLSNINLVPAFVYTVQ